MCGRQAAKTLPVNSYWIGKKGQRLERQEAERAKPEGRKGEARA